MVLDSELRGSCREGYTSENFQRLSQTVVSATGVCFADLLRGALVVYGWEESHPVWWIWSAVPGALALGGVVGAEG
ncbi:Uncharacterised protein [Mycobacteroides abscessus subsp. abscessus]|jgi:hypothetical protein|nr:Uncharacterised protein [Mycobacteroides abscessus subsp. abscessus]